MLAAATGIGVAPPAFAGDVARDSVEAAIDAGFTELERQMVEKYYGKLPPQPAEVEAVETNDAGKGEKPKDSKHGGRNKDLPPGLAKRDALPPGLARRATLPPGLEKRSLPADLEEQLPPAPEGYERRIVADTAVVLIHKATGTVVDIIKDVLIPPADD
jgi:hypothetical protein